MVRLVLEDGRELLASPGHPAVGGGTVGDLQPGDTYAGASVVSTDRVPYGDGATYDILPSGDTGRYWANGILVGSSLRETVPTAVVDVVLRAPPTLRRPTGPTAPSALTNQVKPCHAPPGAPGRPVPWRPGEGRTSC
ncbi:MAG TPA: Hint domain-containing protein [Methylomirabilota bacterium]|jgi:hypothetical protein